MLVASGGNSIRTWGVSPEVLDQAQAKGLTVLMGLRVHLVSLLYESRCPGAPWLSDLAQPFFLAKPPSRKEPPRKTKSV